MTPTRNVLTHHRLLRFAVAVVFAGGIIAWSQAAHASSYQASLSWLGGTPVASSFAPASVEWVDGADEFPCLNDDRGAALAQLPGDKWCTPIPGCYQDDDGLYVLPSRSTGIWQGNPAEVKYADELGPTPTTPPATTPKPATPAPTTPRPTTPRPSTGTNPGWGGGSTPGAVAPGVSTGPAASGDGSIAPVPGQPTAPAAPTLVATDSNLEVTWAPHADNGAEGVTGFVVEINGSEPVAVDAFTSTYTFADVADGTYVAVVRAVNEVGESASSPASDSVTIGTPVAEVVGTVEVEGSLTPGATVTVIGTGFAANVPNFDLELHSTPVALGDVASDASGGFSASVVIPDTVEPGDHSIVVLHDGVEISSAPVLVVAAVGEAAAAAPTEVAVAAAGAVGASPSVVGVTLLVAVMVGLGGVLFWQRRRSLAAVRNAAADASVSAPAPTIDLDRTQPLQEVS